MTIKIILQWLMEEFYLHLRQRINLIKVYVNWKMARKPRNLGNIREKCPEVPRSLLPSNLSCPTCCSGGDHTFVPIHTWAHTIVPTHVCAHTRLCPDTFVPSHVCAHTRLCPHTFVPIHTWAHTIVPTHVCAHTRLCPDTFVPSHVCAHTRLCPHTFVPTHVCAHTRLCPHSFVLTLVCAHTCLYPNTFVSWHVLIAWSQSCLGRNVYVCVHCPDML